MKQNRGYRSQFKKTLLGQNQNVKLYVYSNICYLIINFKISEEGSRKIKPDLFFFNTVVDVSIENLNHRPQIK